VYLSDSLAQQAQQLLIIY